MNTWRENSLAVLRDAQCVLLDFDGTLVDSHQGAFGAFFEFARISGIKATDDGIRRFDGLTTFEIVERVKTEWRLSESVETLTRKYFELLAKSYEQAVEVPTATVLLEYFSERHKKLALVTSAAQQLIEPVVQRLGWEDLFDCRIFGMRGVPGKPDPALYRMALSELCVSPENAIAIEDSVMGVRAAAAANISTIAVAKTEVPAALQGAGARFVVNDLRGLWDLLK